MRKNRHLTDEIRLQIIQEHLEGASKYSLAKKYNLKSASKIRIWMIKFGIEDREESSLKPFVMAKKQTESEKVAALQLEIKRLKKDLAYEKMRSNAYDTMIDVAEEMFNIPIRKKAGTKQ